MTDKRWDDRVERVEPRIIHDGTRHAIWLDVTPHGTCVCASDVQRALEERDAEIAELLATVARLKVEAEPPVEWRCDACGAAYEIASGMWRHSSDGPEHAHGQAGHMPATWVGEGERPLHGAVTQVDGLRAEIARLNALLRVEREACDEARRLCDIAQDMTFAPWATAHDKRRAEEMGA